MNFIELILAAVGLSMDAFSVAICKGLSIQHVKPKYYFIVGAWFGGFQALMPIVGYWLGATFAQYISSFDHWITFGLLAFVGGRMIQEGIRREDTPLDASFSPRAMALLSIATSIDAMAIGITFSLMPSVNVYGASALIGVITFGFSALGLKIGSVFGARFKYVAEIIGGSILVLLGLFFLLEDLIGS